MGRGRRDLCYCDHFRLRFQKWLRVLNGFHFLLMKVTVLVFTEETGFMEFSDPAGYSVWKQKQLCAVNKYVFVTSPTEDTCTHSEMTEKFQPTWLSLILTPKESGIGLLILCCGFLRNKGNNLNSRCICFNMR